MPLTNAEFAAILEDAKRIEGDIGWSADEDRSPSLIFRAEIESAGGWPLFVQGRYNQLARTLTYALILKSEGRIYALDMGRDHHNPQCNQTGKKHMHRWSERYKDKEAQIPDEVTASVDDPVAVWRQFCREAHIQHNGIMNLPRKLGERFP